MAMMEFIEQSNKAQDTDELVGLFCRALGAYGYNRFLCLGTDNHLPDFIHSKHGPTHRTHDFVVEYAKRSYRSADPLFKILNCLQRPFMRNELWQLNLSKKQQEIMHFREEFTIGKVVVVPVRGRDGKLGGMGIGGACPDARTDRNTLAQLYAITNQFHLCRDNLADPAQLALPDVHLSPRERQMLQWCSQGKSNSVIGTILGISEKTVEFHLRSVFRKLEVTTRTTAVLKAVNLRLLSI